MLGQDLEVRIRVRLHRLGVPNIQAPRKVLARVETGCNSRWRKCACSGQHCGEMILKLCAVERQSSRVIHCSIATAWSKVQCVSSACTGTCYLPDQC